MNTVSGEFETGTIVPLLTKPVSRSTIFLGKILAAFITLLAAYTFLGVYMIIGGSLAYGPQDNLHLVPLGIIGLTIGTLVWASIVATLGTLSKNSIVAALGSFGLFIGLSIVGLVLSGFGQSAVLFYAPGDGAPATTGSCTGGGGFGADTFSAGTNALGSLLINWVLNPGLVLNFCGVSFTGNIGEPYLISSDAISSVALRTFGISIGYIAVLLVVSWFFFRRSEIAE
jgi:ABC-type transport system involved in multi-copper enzyme maturation permease subunit